jgi:glyceraldehyde 3-phosphate dehydrogenase
MTTPHAYTNDQPSHDQFPQGPVSRAGGGTLHDPDLDRGGQGGRPGSAGTRRQARGGGHPRPTPNVSAVNLKFVAKRATSKEEVNGAVKRATERQFTGILGYTDWPNVSIDFNHDPRSKPDDRYAMAKGS